MRKFIILRGAPGKTVYYSYSDLVEMVSTGDLQPDSSLMEQLPNGSLGPVVNASEILQFPTSAIHPTNFVSQTLTELDWTKLPPFPPEFSKQLEKMIQEEIANHAPGQGTVKPQEISSNAAPPSIPLKSEDKKLSHEAKTSSPSAGSSDKKEEDRMIKVHWPTFIKSISALAALAVCVSIIRSCNHEERRRQAVESFKQDALMRQGYRLNENGVMAPLSEEEKWKQGIDVDYKYEGRDRSGKVSVFAKKGEKKVYVQRMDYDESGLYGNSSFEGEWQDKGVVWYRDRDGSQRIVTITDRYE